MHLVVIIDNDAVARVALLDVVVLVLMLPSATSGDFARSGRSSLLPCSMSFEQAGTLFERTAFLLLLAGSSGKKEREKAAIAHPPPAYSLKKE